MGFSDLRAEQLIDTNDLNKAASVFKAGVKLVEIEVFSYCNRQCWYCPNSKIDRHSSNTYMQESIYSMVIDQLASIKYSHMISYSRYNEPLADRIILSRISEARKKLPSALLHTNTNGDYLDHDYLAELHDAGLRSLNIQLYLGPNDVYAHEAIKARGRQTLARVRVPSVVTNDVPGKWYEEKLQFRDMAIRMYGRNFSVNGTSRAGQVDIYKSYVRTSPCLMPFWSVYIDHNGSVMPCCNLRSDVPEHISSVQGDLSTDNNLFRIYASPAAVRFRRMLLNENVKSEPCRSCSFVTEGVNPERAQQMQSLLAAAMENERQECQ